MKCAQLYIAVQKDTQQGNKRKTFKFCHLDYEKLHINVRSVYNIAQCQYMFRLDIYFTGNVSCKKKLQAHNLRTQFTAKMASPSLSGRDIICGTRQNQTKRNEFKITLNFIHFHFQNENGMPTMRHSILKIAFLQKKRKKNNFFFSAHFVLLRFHFTIIMNTMWIVFL